MGNAASPCRHQDYLGHAGARCRLPCDIGCRSGRRKPCRVSPWQDAGNAGQLEEAFGHGWFPDKNKWYAERYERIILRGVRRTSDIFQVNDVMTTLFGPAWANIWLEGENFLECSPPQGRDFSYALCYYSGPEDPTGQSADNPALPCTLSPSGKLANCKCYKLSTDQVPPKVPYFVDIHAILNKDIYLKTVEACGEDGSKCAPTTSIEAPVCSSINSNQLIPGADLVSVFSPVKKLDYFAGSTPCKSLYAGCMTAPCYDTGEKDANGKPLVDCSCPIFEGPFEIGQGADQGGGNQLQCELGGRNVWSAAHNPKSNNPITPQPPAGACFPDAPPDSGCPLYPAGSGSVDPNGAVCRTVCEAYSGDPAAGESRLATPVTRLSAQRLASGRIYRGASPWLSDSALWGRRAMVCRTWTGWS
ncbi:hypothetical protein [Microbulbifer taiwanensis]|uniref:hypothetical protein n=1 Tax=Microbulbifer taiwanensis TaxID=986746 RepID=UPI0036224FDD